MKEGVDLQVERMRVEGVVGDGGGLLRKKWREMVKEGVCEWWRESRRERVENRTWKA